MYNYCKFVNSIKSSERERVVEDFAGFGIFGAVDLYFMLYCKYSMTSISVLHIDWCYCAS